MKIDAQRESDSIVNRPTTKPHRHGVVSSMLPSFLDSSLNRVARVFDDRETFGCGYRFLKRNEREIAKTYGRY